MATDPKLFALAETAIDDLIKAGWHPDKIIDAVGLMYRGAPDYTESLISDWVWGNYQFWQENGGKEKGTKQRSIANEVKRYIKCLDPCELFLNEVYEELQISLPQDRAAAQAIFCRLSSNGGPLQKIGRGKFRVKVPDCQEIDIFGDVGEPLNIKWPLGIHELFITMQKNIIIVAGEPDAGKTAFLLNCAYKNMHAHEVNYFSSEMGAMELKVRLQKFKAPLDIWKAVLWKERADGFADVIRPDAINIIDFLEVHDDFFKIGGLIKDIFDKLNKGIAIIALQKNEGRDTGLGGFRSLEKARLYLSMEKQGRTKIVKCKNWRDEEVNPNGLSKRWRLGGGCYFKEEGGWIKEEIPNSPQLQSRR